jgi:prepilin-type N-terminal cleavage/methylation domain-containing protein
MDSNDAGFSLVEVLVALTVSALLMAAAYRGLALGTRGMRVGNTEARLLEVAKNELARAGVETPLVESEYSGRSGTVDWTLTISPYVGEFDEEGAFRTPRAFWVEVKARIQGRPVKRLTTLKLDGLGK